jgi:hypothetical protein
VTAPVPKHIRSWLEQVPHVDDSVVRLTGRLDTRLPGEVAVVVGRTRFVFALEDVVRVVPANYPREAMLYLRRGSVLLSAESIDETASSARRPFALCVRHPVTRTEAAPRFREIEQRFLRAHGLAANE